MAGGFLTSPEKDYVQGTLFLPVIRKAWERNGGRPLRMLCLPGRECRFLLRLLEKGYTSLDRAVCLERDGMESLFIRGRLAELGSGTGRVPANIVGKSVYEYLTDPETDPVAQQFQAIDLDVYGTIGDDRSELLQTVGAAVDVQVRTNIRDWVLLVTTEIASKRTPGIQTNLRAADAAMIAEEGDPVRTTLPDVLIQNAGVEGCVRRFMAGAGARLARAALPSFRAEPQGYPLVYRGSSEAGERRALMGAIALRMCRPERPIAGLGKQRPEVERVIIQEVARKCASCRGVILDDTDKVGRTDDLVAVVRE